MQAVLLQSKPSITFSAFTYEQLEAEAFTLELGKARPFGQNEQVNLDKLEDRLIRIITAEEPEDEDSLEGLQLFSVSREIIAQRQLFTCTCRRISRIFPN